MAIYPFTGRPGRPRPAAGGWPGGPPDESLRAEFRMICGLDLAVESLRDNPSPARFDLGDGPVLHRAAFEVARDGETWLVDLAHPEDLPAHPLRMAQVLGELEAHDGRRFRFETAESLRAEPRLSALRLVLACRGTPISPGDRVAVLHHLAEAGTSTLVEASAMARHAPDGVAAVLALAAEGLIALELSGPILPETRLRRRAPGSMGGV